MTLLMILAAATALGYPGKSSQVQQPSSSRLEVVCGRDRMTVHVHFRQPFRGLVFSHAPDGRCVHVGPGAGVTSASFDIRYDSCGTREDAGGRFHENTLVVQFDEDILEAWDEAKRLRCEWLESFEKKSSYKPALAIADLDVVELNFQGDDIDCWMEVQEGKGPWSRRVEGLVPMGSPLTLVIAIDDPSRQFDMRVKRCTAGDGKGRTELQLTDAHGCVSRPSLLTPFAKVREHGATLVAYSHLHAFKFPDQMDVYVHCVVEVCRHGCTETCHTSPQYGTLESQKTEKWAAPPPQKPDHVFPGREKNRPSVHRQQSPQTTPVRKNVLRPPPSAPAPRSPSEEETHDGGGGEVKDSKRRQSVAHRIVGHDAHWIQDDVTWWNRTPPSSADGQRSKTPYVDERLHSQSLGPVPQPEPAAVWTLEELRSPVPSPEEGLLSQRHVTLAHREIVPPASPQSFSQRTPSPSEPRPTTSRYQKPRNSHRYPYPVPQFSPRIVVAGADRRTDDDEEESLLHRRTESGHQDSRSVPIGETAAGHRKSDAGTGSEVSSDSGQNPGGFRSAVSGFVPPTLDPPTVPFSVPRPLATELRTRKKRSSEPVFQVRQKFRVVAPSDLAFEWNNGTSAAAVVRGRPADSVAYGVCVSTAGMSAGVGLMLLFTLAAVVASVVLYERSCQLSRSKTSTASRHLNDWVAGSFEGRLGALVDRIARPHLYVHQ